MIPGNLYGHLSRIPFLNSLFHILFAEWVVGIGIPLVVRLFVSAYRLFPLRIVGGALSGYHLKLRSQHVPYQEPLIVFLIS